MKESLIMTIKAPAIEIGLSPDHRQQISEGLGRLLADTYTLYLKTHNYHWNVTGPMFSSLHEMFEQHYTEMAEAIDEIAERIRSLGFRAPGSYSEFLKLTSVTEETGDPDAMQMVANLVEGQQTVVRTARQLMDVASEAGDEPTADLLTQRMQIHEKNAWMLRSILG